MANSTRNRPSISKTNKNWYSDEQISALKRDSFEKGVDHFTQVYLKEYHENIDNAQEKGALFFKIAQEQCNVNFKQIRLKPNYKNSFELIFVMSEEDFSSEERFRCVSNAADEFIEKEFGDKTSVIFSYLPSNDIDTLNNNEFTLNGFLFTYDPFRNK